jgi:hypothetical protein
MQVPQIPMTESRVGRSSKSLNPFIHNALMTSYGSLRTFVASDPHWVHTFRRLAPLFHNEDMSSDSFITDLYS